MKSLSENELNMVAGGGLYEGELESYTVLPGEDLTSIAEKFGTKPGVLFELNYPNIDESMLVTAGQVIQVPLRKTGKK